MNTNTIICTNPQCGALMHYDAFTIPRDTCSTCPHLYDTKIGEQITCKEIPATRECFCTECIASRERGEGTTREVTQDEFYKRVIEAKQAGDEIARQLEEKWGEKSRGKKRI